MLKTYCSCCICIMAIGTLILSAIIIDKVRNVMTYSNEVCFNATDLVTGGNPSSSYGEINANVIDEDNTSVVLYYPSIYASIARKTVEDVVKWGNNLINSNNFTCMIDYENKVGVTSVYNQDSIWMFSLAVSIVIILFFMCRSGKANENMNNEIPPLYEQVPNTINMDTPPPKYSNEPLPEYTEV